MESWRKVVCCLGLVCLCLGVASSSFADTYYVNGKLVSGSTYQAYRLLNRAVGLMRRNQTAAAAIEIRRALKVEPTLADAHSALGIALARLGDLDDSAEQFRMAMADNPESPMPILNLGGLYQSAGKLNDALEVYERFLKQFPNSKEQESVQERVRLLRAEIANEKRGKTGDTADSYLGNARTSGPKRWATESMPIKVYIAPGDGVKDFQPQYRKILRGAFTEWQNKSHNKVSFAFVDRPSHADIRCMWVDDPAKMSSSAEDGEAQIQSLLNGISQVDILLSINSAGSPFPLTDNLVQAVSLHEIGHSLGLIGHSADPDDVMFCTSPFIDREKHLSKRDVNTLVAIYSEDLDAPSRAMTWLHRTTNGNTIPALRLGIVVLTTIIVGVLMFFALVKKTSKKKNKSSAKKK